MLNTVEDATLLTKRDQLMMISWLPAQKMIFPWVSSKNTIFGQLLG